jgi:NAD(P)-dependent dehydrogenase (short-subunit alcohol dehydrogenase family)
VLVNNADIYPSISTTTLDEAAFDSVVAVNVRAPFFLVQEPGMIERGGGVVIPSGTLLHAACALREHS